MQKSSYKLVFYFILTYLISWAIELPLVLNTQFGLSLPTIPMQHYFSSFSPFLAAFGTQFFFHGRTGVRNFISIRFNPRIHLKWYLLVLGGPFALYILSALIQYLLTGEFPSLRDFGITSELPGWGWIAVWLFWTLTFGLGEETGWRGLALPELQKKMSPLQAAYLLSMFWGLWHLPFFFEQQNFMEMNGFMIIGWFISLVFGSVFVAWLFNVSGKNVIIPALWHGTFNTAVTGKGTIDMMPAMISAMLIIFTLFLIFWPRSQLKVKKG